MDPSIRPAVLAVAGIVLVIWGIGAVLPVGVDQPGLLYLVSDYVYSAMLASWAVIAWLSVRVAPDRVGVRSFAWLLAGAGLLGSVGNLLEDVVGVAGAEYLYGLGLFGGLTGFVGLSIALVVARRRIAALVVALTLVGIIVMGGHGPPVVPLVWLAVALAVSVLPREAVTARVPAETSLEAETS